jgi:thioredoxin 2
MVAPEVRKAASELAGRALVIKVDTEIWPGLASRYGVQSIPNLVITRQGRVVHQHAGAVDYAQMAAWIDGAAGRTPNP